MRSYLVFAGVVVGVAGGWLFLLPPAPIAQPLAFNHASHRTMACSVCHRGAETAARAAIPQGDICLKCHATAPKAAGAFAVWRDAGQGARIPWVRVARVPDHVYFSHRRHASLAKLDCASCHADVGQRTAPPGRAPVRLDMDACIACHSREGASQDCAACHR